MKIAIYSRMAGKRHRCLICHKRIKAGKLTGARGVTGGDHYKFVRIENRRFCFCQTHDETDIRIWFGQKFPTKPMPIPELSLAHRPLTTHELERVLCFVANGVRDSRIIANELQRHQSTVERLFERCNIKSIVGRNYQATMIVQFLNALRRYGHHEVNGSLIGRLPGVQPTTVSYHAKRQGLILLPRGRPRTNPH